MILRPDPELTEKINKKYKYKADCSRSQNADKNLYMMVTLVKKEQNTCTQKKSFANVLFFCQEPRLLFFLPKWP